MSVPRWVEKGGWVEGWKKPWIVGTSATSWPRFKRALRRHGYLSPHFTIAEAASKPGCGCPTGLPKRKRRRAQKLAFKLEKARHKLGDNPIGVLSWYRNPCKNNCVGGASASRHMSADALDPIKGPGYTQAEFNNVLASVFDGGGIGRGCSSGNVQHVDLGARRRWCYPGR